MQSQTTTYPENLFKLISYHENHWVEPYGKYKPDRPITTFFISYINRQLDKLECAIMPAKRKAKQQQWNGSNVEFVNINLSTKQKEQFKAWFAETEPEIPNLIATFIASGYKMSLRHDADNDCYLCAVTCFDNSLENYNKCLTSRSQDWLEAMALNLFKTDVVSEDGIWEGVTQGNSWG